MTSSQSHISYSTPSRPQGNRGGILGWLLLRLIDIYAVTIGPHVGGRCRFHPSCSEYAREAIHIHGSARGSWLALKRLAKCGPWHKGGHDPVPD